MESAQTPLMRQLMQETGQVCTDVLLGGQNELLEMIATGVPLEKTLTRLVLLIESQCDGMLGSLLLADADGIHLRHGAAPSLPDAYNKAADGIAIGPRAGSCGTAAYRKEPVIVTDIARDPLWENGRDMAIGHGLLASWSAPVISQQGRVLGTFAMYYRERRGPSPIEKQLIGVAIHIARIAIEHKQAREALHLSEEELRWKTAFLEAQVDVSIDGILVVDAHNKKILQNRRFLEIMQIPKEIAEEADDKKTLRFVHGNVKNPDQFIARVAHLYAHPDETGRDEIELKDGTVLDRYSSPMSDKLGRYYGRIWSFRDITERKRTERELLESQTLYHSFVEHMPAGVFRKDFEGRFIFVNSVFCRLKNMTAREILGKTPLEVAEYEARVKHSEGARQRTLIEGEDHHKLILKTGKPIEVEEVYPQPGGKVEYFQVVKSPVFGPDGRVIGSQGIQFEITELRRLQEQLLQSQKMEAFGQLAAGVAHDFNNVLTVIQGNLSLLEAGRFSKEEQSAAIEQCMASAERAANLTRQLLTFGRRQVVRPVDLDLNEVVASIARMLRHVIGENISMETMFAPSSMPVHADLGMMEQMMVNLAVNSRDAMPNGGRLILETSLVTVGKGHIKPKAGVKHGEYVRLRISDTGAGIAPEHLPHVFEPFFTTKDVGKGTGLGLATVFGILDQHLGWVDVESKLNEGTTFFIYLPRRAPAAVVIRQPDEKTEVRDGNETILLVEDETAVRALMKTWLKRHGYHVHEAASGAQALKSWDQIRDSIDLLVTDMVMPEGISGRELADRLLADKPGLKVIYCSGYNDDVLGADSPLRGNPNFLEKPFYPHKFLQRVRQCLDAPAAA